MEDHIVNFPGIDIVGIIQPIIGLFTDKAEVFHMAQKTVGIVMAVCIVLIVALLIGILISVEGIRQIRKKEEAIYEAHVDPGYEEAQVTQGDPHLAKRWDTILEHLESENQNDWKQAILEADVILENLLTKLGYQGEGIGEKLRRVDRADFKTLDQAGEAHGVRNRIAHDAGAFLLSHHEARRVVNLYRQVFEEFFFI